MKKININHSEICPSCSLGVYPEHECDLSKPPLLKECGCIDQEKYGLYLGKFRPIYCAEHAGSGLGVSKEWSAEDARAYKAQKEKSKL